GTYRTQSTSPLALEPRYSLARWDGDQLTVWKASRNVYGDRDKLAKVFGLTHDQLRGIGPYLGGGFGSKNETRVGAITALLARKAQARAHGIYAGGRAGLRKMASRNCNSNPHGTQARRHHHCNRRHERAEHRPLRSRLWRRVSVRARTHLPLFLP